MNVVNLMPGVHFNEVEFVGATKPIAGVSISAGAIVGYFEKGEVDVVRLITTFADFEVHYGGPIDNAYSWYAVKGFFDNGGKELYVVRTTKHDVGGVTESVKASRNLENATVPAYKFEALTEGTWGNDLSVKSVRSNLISGYKVTANAAIGDKIVKLDKIANIKVGNVLSIASTVPNTSCVVASVDAVTKTVTFVSPLASIVAINDLVSSEEYDITVYKNDDAVEVYKNLSQLALSNNIVEVINGSSSYIRVTALVTPTTPLENDVTPAYLIGGNDALLGIADGDLLGTSSTKTGVHALDLTAVVFNLFVVESQSAFLNRSLLEYCESRMNAFAIISVPNSMDYAEAKTYREETGAFDSSYGALYYQHGYVYDPLSIALVKKKLVPLEGHIAGLITRVDLRYGYHQNPAGELAKLAGVIELEHELGSGEMGILNNLGVNCITKFSGIGIVVWGCRTLSSDSTWRYINKRRIFLYVEISLVTGTRWAVFKATNDATWKSLKRSITNFLDSVSGLSGATREERYQVVNDGTVNTQSIIDQGVILNRVGLNVEGVGEFVWFEIGQSRNGVSLTE